MHILACRLQHGGEEHKLWVRAEELRIWVDEELGLGRKIDVTLACAVAHVAAPAVHVLGNVVAEASEEAAQKVRRS